jgi:hypothetical protein
MIRAAAIVPLTAYALQERFAPPKQVPLFSVWRPKLARFAVITTIEQVRARREGLEALYTDAQLACARTSRR